jgi:PAS domain S-box-containing protein/diguanylate cyclase (GGDEF)-like protein
MRSGALRRVALGRAAGLVLVTGVYVIGIVALVGTAGAGIIAMSAIPALLSGALFGLRVGLLYTAGLIAFNVAVALTLEPTARAVFFAGGVIGSIALLTIAAISGQLHDIGDRLRRSEAQLRAVVGSSLNAIIGMDISGRIVDWNPQAEAMFGWSREEALGRTVAETVVPPMLQPSHLHGLERYRRTGEARIVGQRLELEAVHRSGRVFPIEMTISEVSGGAGGFSASIRDMSEVVAQREQLEHLAAHDPLTGLPNRVVLRDRIELAIARTDGEAGYGLLLLDLHQFARVNTAHGREIGDDVLRQVAERLQRLATPGDTVSRIGGDRFGLLVDRVADVDDLSERARAVSSLLESPFTAAGIRFQLAGSVGGALGPEPGGDAETLVRHAEAAVDVARTLPERFAMFDQALEVRTADRRRLITDLRTALATNGLSVVYQPIVDIGSGRCSSVEALCRWDHPTQGTISPETFIELAESSGLIDSLELWVLDAALEQSARWEAEGFTVGIAVNIAPQHLSQGAIAPALAVAIRSRSLRPDRVTVEITESALGTDPAASVRAGKAIRDLGIRISVDDFGTGYSSFSVLQLLVIDQLKIDRSFVAGALSDEQSAAIVRTAVDLGHRLGARVVAEGVETAEQLEFLRRAGCDEAQGYLFSRPLVPDDLASWLREHDGRGLSAPGPGPR